MLRYRPHLWTAAESAIRASPAGIPQSVRVSHLSALLCQSTASRFPLQCSLSSTHPTPPHHMRTPENLIVVTLVTSRFRCDRSRSFYENQARSDEFCMMRGHFFYRAIRRFSEQRQTLHIFYLLVFLPFKSWSMSSWLLLRYSDIFHNIPELLDQSRWWMH